MLGDCSSRRVLGCVLLVVSLVSPAVAVPLPGYSAGSGANTSYLVIDFATDGGDAYVFEYAYDGSATGMDMLQAVEAAGSFELFTTSYSFGLSVDGFAYGGHSADVGFDMATGRFWSYWLDGGFERLSVGDSYSLEAVAAGSYSEPLVGAADRLLEDGSVDGWIINVSEFNDQGHPPTSHMPAVIPEPTTAMSVLALLTLGLVRRHRRRDER